MDSEFKSFRKDIVAFFRNANTAIDYGKIGLREKSRIYEDFLRAESCTENCQNSML
jgi:hypothetical protein